MDMDQTAVAPEKVALEVSAAAANASQPVLPTPPWPLRRRGRPGADGKGGSCRDWHRPCSRRDDVEGRAGVGLGRQANREGSGDRVDQGAASAMAEVAATKKGVGRRRGAVEDGGGRGGV
ncbi:hypothetical protein I4F81_009879 [Pyropia yezoensis]|uniref:Uncharacterized protein n=1 Tax=Pyropia yezoensis TaxID=2788 RepID=A0ACC3CC59_PYRYE|nr:hypothetical protein I4F81_009879 [Neopyropia yezoensis]